MKKALALFMILATATAFAQSATDTIPPLPIPAFTWPQGPSLIALPPLGADEADLGFAFDGGDLLVGRYRRSGDAVTACSILVLDPENGALRATHSLEATVLPRAIAVADGVLCVLTSSWLSLYDRTSFARQAQIDLRPYKPDASWYYQSMATADGEIFYFVFLEENAVYRWTRETGSFERWSVLPENTGPRALTIRGTELFVLDPFHALIYGIDTASGGLRSETLFSFPRHHGYRPMAYRGDVLYLYNRELSALRSLPLQRIGDRIVRSDPVRVRVEARITIRNTSASRAAAGVRVLVAAPSTELHQSIEALSFQGPGLTRERDRYESEMAAFTIARLAPGAESTVGWTADAVVWNVRHRVDPAVLRPLTEIPQAVTTQYLSTNFARLSPGDRGVDLLAAETARPGGDLVSLVRRTRDAVWDRLVYNMDGVWADAGAVLAQGHGSCAEYSFLTSALLRRNGLPTRFVDATIDGQLVDATDRIYHRWIEVYFPGCGWAPMDTNTFDGDAEATHRDRLVFGESGNTLIVWRGGGEDETYLGTGNAARVVNSSGIQRDLAYIWDVRE